MAAETVGAEVATPVAVAVEIVISAVAVEAECSPSVVAAARQAIGNLSAAGELARARQDS